MRKILVTGAAGFIGFHLCERLLEDGDEVIGLDNLNDYYDVKLKRDRLGLMEGRRNFEFVKVDLTDRDAIGRLFSERRFDMVVNLAAQAGVWRESSFFTGIKAYLNMSESLLLVQPVGSSFLLVLRQPSLSSFQMLFPRRNRIW